MADELIATIEALTTAAQKLDGAKGVKELQGLTRALSDYAAINWSKFGRGAAEGLATFDGLKDSFGKVAESLKAFEGVSTESVEVFKDLSKGLSLFSDIDWNGVKVGLESIKQLKDTFKQAQAGFEAFAIAVKVLSNSSKDFEAFTLLSEALKTFSDIDWDGVNVGLESISELKDTFAEAPAGFEAFAKAVKDLSNSSKDFEAFTLLSNSLKTFSDIDWGKVIWGFTMMATLPKLIKVAANGFKEFAIAVRGLKNSSKDFEAFTLLSNSLKTFSEIAWGKVILGFAMMAILPKLIKVAANGFKEFAIAVRGLKNSSKDFEGFKALSESLKAFGDIKWGKVLFGLIALKMISPLFKVFGKAVNELGKSIGSKEAKQTIQSFVQFTNALKTFGEIRWGMVFIGTVILRLFAGALKVFASAQGAMNISMKMLKVFVRGLSLALTQLGVAATNPLFWIGMAALAAFALILIGFGVACVLAGVGVLLIAIAFERFMKAAFEGLGMLLGLADRASDLIKVAGAIALLAYGMGLFAVAGLLAIPAILALGLFSTIVAVLGGALTICAKGVQLIARAFERFVKAAFDGIDKMIELGKSAPGLLKAALAIALVSAAMIAFAAAGVASSGGGLISGFFDKITPGMGPMEKIMALAQAADGLDKTATALERINAALNAMPSKDGIDLSVAGSEGAQNASNARTAAHTAGQNSAGGGKKTINNKVSTVVFNNSWMPDRSSALILAHAF